MPLVRGGDGTERIEWSQSIKDQQQRIADRRERIETAEKNKFAVRQKFANKDDRYFVVICTPFEEEPATQYVVGVYKTEALAIRKGIEYKISQVPELTPENFRIERAYVWTF